MEGSRLDRRQRKTRQVILTTCNELLQDYDFHKLTISEITNRADINRGTFYLHFEDKFDMLSSYERELIEKLRAAIMEHLPNHFTKEAFIDSRYDTMVQIFTVLAENKDLLSFVLKTSYASFQQKLGQMFKSIIEQHLLLNIEFEGDFPLDLVMIMFTSFLLSYAEYINRSDSTMNIEEAADFLYDLMLEGPVKKFGFA